MKKLSFKNLPLRARSQWIHSRILLLWQRIFNLENFYFNVWNIRHKDSFLTYRKLTKLYLATGRKERKPRARWRLGVNRDNKMSQRREISAPLFSWSFGKEQLSRVLLTIQERLHCGLLERKGAWRSITLFLMNCVCCGDYRAFPEGDHTEQLLWDPMSTGIRRQV